MKPLVINHYFHLVNAISNQLQTYLIPSRGWHKNPSSQPSVIDPLGASLEKWAADPYTLPTPARTAPAILPPLIIYILSPTVVSYTVSSEGTVVYFRHPSLKIRLRPKSDHNQAYQKSESPFGKNEDPV